MWNFRGGGALLAPAGELTIVTVKHPRSSRRGAKRKRSDEGGKKEGGREQDIMMRMPAKEGERQGGKSEGGLAAVAPGNGINKGREG